MRMQLNLSAMVFALIAFGWTAAGETSDPILVAGELPLDVIRDCAADTPSAAQACYGKEEEYTNRWIGRTGKGDLFLVMRAPCADGNGCRVWFVEKTDKGASTLLAVDGQFRLYKSTSAYPTIQTRTVLSTLHSAYNRFEWTGERYARTESKLVYQIDGSECGTRAECRQAARAAMQQEDVDRTVKIWESVHGVSWI